MKRLVAIVALAVTFVLLWPEALAPELGTGADRAAGIPAAARPDPSSVRVAAVQFASIPGAVAENLAQMELWARRARAAGAEIVLFHESSLVDYTLAAAELAEELPDGESCRRMLALARELDCILAFGLAERDGERRYITQAFVGPDGLVARYRKTWLWGALDPQDAGSVRDEWARFDPGDGPAAFEIAGLRAAALICADSFSARCRERLRALGPDLIFFPNNRPWMPAVEGERGLGRLARELGATLVAANRAAPEGTSEGDGGAALGGSAILDRTGRPLARANRDGQAELVFADLPRP